MAETKDRFHISEDELMYREFLQDQWRIKPSRKAVLILQDRISEVLKRLGVDTDRDAESIRFQMQMLDIYINSLGEEQAPKAAGLYISARVRGELQAYAYISAAKVKKGEYWFPIIYWLDERLDEGKAVKLN